MSNAATIASLEAVQEAAAGLATAVMDAKAALVAAEILPLKEGDTVRITGLSEYGSNNIGKTGTVGKPYVKPGTVEVFVDSIHFVYKPSNLALVTPADEIKVGDAVRIVHGYYTSGTTPSVVDGWEGTVSKIDTDKSPVCYHVTITDDKSGRTPYPGDVRVAREVARIQPAPTIKVGDRVEVVRDYFNRQEAVGKVGTVEAIDYRRYGERVPFKIRLESGTIRFTTEVKLAAPAPAPAPTPAPTELTITSGNREIYARRSLANTGARIQLRSGGDDWAYLHLTREETRKLAATLQAIADA